MLLQNLIGNTIKYNDKKPPKSHISSKKETNRYVIGVKDNGIGMKPEHLERIFTIFKRLHSKEEYEGTGIGLAIASENCSSTQWRNMGRIHIWKGNNILLFHTTKLIILRIFYLKSLMSN
jgi:light-regulated signal transduction histidine kinase (bacteriophytochrome)